MKKSIFEKIFRIILFILLFALLFMVFQNVLSYKWKHEGSMYDQYEEEKDVDVLFCGASNTRMGISPAVIWDECGITSYNLASSSVTKMMMYYQLKCALRRNVPKLVVIDVSSMFTNKNLDQHADAYEMNYRKLVGTMPDLDIRIEMIRDICSRYPSQDAKTWYFPLLRYHTRWEELTEDDFHSEETPDYKKGCIMNPSIVPQTWNGDVIEKDATELNLEYMNKMVKLCRKYGCEVLFAYYPRVQLFSGDIETGEELAEKYDAEFVSFTSEEALEAAGIDLSTDLFDHKHLNVIGQEKMSRWFARYFKEHYDFESHENEKILCEDWDKNYRQYEKAYKKLSARARKNQK